MSKTRVFTGVTFERLSRMQEEDRGDYALALEPGRIGGTVHKPTPLGVVVVRFAHDIQRAEMTVTILKKPVLVPAEVVWVGVSRALRRGDVSK